MGTFMNVHEPFFVDPVFWHKYNTIKYKASIEMHLKTFGGSSGCMLG